MSSRRSNRNQPKDHSKPLRVGFATPSLGRGGAERWILTLAKYFSRAIVCSGILTWDIEGVLAREASRYGRLWWPFESIQFLDQTDVVIAWGLPGLPQVPGMAEYKGQVIAVSHGTSMQPFHRKTNADLASIKGCKMAAVSDNAARSFPDGSAVTVIPNGVEVDRCTPRRSREKVREAFGIGLDRKLCAFVSRLGTEKRPGLLAQAVLTLPEEWMCILAGYDCEGEGGRLPRDPRIIHAAPVDCVGDLYNAADVFVLPSTAEAHSLALTEAWIAGIPTVYCEWPFVEQIRRDHGGDLGVVVPVNLNANDLAQAILEAAGPVGLAYAEKARQVAWENYTATAMAARWEDYLGIRDVSLRRVSNPFIEK